MAFVMVPVLSKTIVEIFPAMGILLKDCEDSKDICMRIFSLIITLISFVWRNLLPG